MFRHGFVSLFPEFGNGHGKEGGFGDGQNTLTIVENDTGLEVFTDVGGQALKPLGISHANRTGNFDFSRPDFSAPANHASDCAVKVRLIESASFNINVLLLECDSWISQITVPIWLGIIKNTAPCQRHVINKIEGIPPSSVTVNHS